MASLAVTDVGRSASRSDEDSPDRIGSPFSTPGSGFATPRPDPADKRLPCIKHGYLGQVGARPSSACPRHLPTPSVPLSVTGSPRWGLDDDNDHDDEGSAGGGSSGDVFSGHHHHHHHNLDTRGRDPLGDCSGAATMLPTAPSSPQRRRSEAEAEVEGELDGPPLLPHERVDGPDVGDLGLSALTLRSPSAPAAAPASAALAGGDMAMPVWCPTPPLSSRSSLLLQDRNDVVVGAPPPPSSSDTVSPARGEGVCGPVLPFGGRRLTMGQSNPLSGILTTSSVHAAYISSPATPHVSTIPNTPFMVRHASDTAGGGGGVGVGGDGGVPAVSVAPWALPSSLSCSSSSYFELKKLTEGPLAAAREKNTPPRTPRTSSSNEGTPVRASQQRPPTSHPLARTAHDDAVAGAPPQVNGHPVAAAAAAAAATTASSSSGASASTIKATPAGTPEGKLIVKISQARGLRPSRNPYVVCVCDWNEYISKGPRAAGADRARDGGLKPNGVGAVDIRRVNAAGDTGRAVAIPMKSRQSSATGRPDRDGQSTTDPRWDHEAIL